MKKEDIHIRDPFILTDTGSKTYYLYGTTDLNCWDGVCTGFDVYSSNDLEEYEGPFPAFRSPPDFWADQNYWAPEVIYDEETKLYVPLASDNYEALKNDFLSVFGTDIFFIGNEFAKELVFITEKELESTLRSKLELIKSASSVKILHTLF